MTQTTARNQVRRPIEFGMMMLHNGEADGLVSGLTQHYPETIRPALQIIKSRPGTTTVAGLYMLIFKNDVRFITDATVNFEPTAEQLADIAILAAEKVRGLRHRAANRDALLQQFRQHAAPPRAEDGARRGAGEAPPAGPGGRRRDHGGHGRGAGDPRRALSLQFTEGGANVLVCPELQSANIATKLLAKLGGADCVGPILLGIRKPVYLLIPGNEVTDIVNVTAMAVRDAQEVEQAGTPASKPPQLSTVYE